MIFPVPPVVAAAVIEPPVKVSVLLPSVRVVPVCERATQELFVQIWDAPRVTELVIKFCEATPEF